MPSHCALPPSLKSVARSITVAAGRFAPGHLGELTSLVPFELVDAVLAEHRATQQRLRELPSRVGVYFLLAMCLFPEVGYRLVWDKLTGALSGLPLPEPSAKALRDLRRRVGAAPMRALFEVLAGSLAPPTTPGVRFGPWRLVSFDGCTSIKAPDTDRNRAWLDRLAHGGYPQLELMTLVETGTRALIGAVFGPTATGETAYATRLLHLLGPDMLVLWDKGFDGNDFLAATVATGAQVLGRVTDKRRLPVLGRLADGSFLSVIGSVKVRIVQADITVRLADGTSFSDAYRLVTTITDIRRASATTLIALYHQRWEHESAYLALRHTIMDGRVLRSGDPVGLEQELWSLLTLYQLLRIAMVDAALSQPGTDPDRCGFTTALHAARDLVVRAENIAPATPDPVGEIGRRVLAALLPPRRLRVSTRKVKSPIRRYSERIKDGRPDTSRRVTALAITVVEPLDDPPLPRDTRSDRHTPGRRRDHVLALFAAEPDRRWKIRELAQHLGDITYNTMDRQLNRWAEAGLINKDGPSAFSATRTPPTPLPPAQIP